MLLVVPRLWHYRPYVSFFSFEFLSPPRPNSKGSKTRLQLLLLVNLCYFIYSFSIILRRRFGAAKHGETGNYHKMAWEERDFWGSIASIRSGFHNWSRTFSTSVDYIRERSQFFMGHTKVETAREAPVEPLRLLNVYRIGIEAIVNARKSRRVEPQKSLSAPIRVERQWKWERWKQWTKQSKYIFEREEQ
jgi:hypothetical protein